MNTYTQSYDIIIAGGGIAGTAAALEASRNGMKTALLEKTVFPGGLATTGLINIYLPLCDGKGRQVIFGIAEELLKASVMYGPGDIPEVWVNSAAPEMRTEERYLTEFNPASFVLALDELLVDAGVDIWFDTLVCGVCKEGDTITGVEVETKSGRIQINAKCFVDATGDADLAYLAGTKCIEGSNWLAGWSMVSSLEMAKQAVADNSGAALMRCVQRGNSFGPEDRNICRKYSGVDARDVTDMLLDSRKMLREAYKSLQSARGANGRCDEFPIALPSMAQFRMTRRIDGMATLTDGDETREFSDSVAISGDWRYSGPVWEIPYGCLLPCNIKGLLAAGRCISTDGDAWDALRVIPPAALTGQISGLAASMSIKQSITPEKLDIDQLRDQLRTRNILYRR